LSAIDPLREVVQPEAEILRLHSEVATYQSGIDETKDRLRVAREAGAPAAEEMAKAEQLEEGLQQIVSQHLLWTKVIQSSLEAFPNVEVVAFSEGLKDLTAVARAPSAAEAVAFVSYLTDTGFFKTVTIQSLNSETQAVSGMGVRFNLTASKGE